MEENSVFFLITSLCEKILERNHFKNESKAKTDYLKRLRSLTYSILLRPGEREFSANPHECFLEAITANFQDRVNSCGPEFEEIDSCVDHLWQKSSTQPFVAPVVYFLSKLHNEGSSVHCDLQQDTYSDDDGASDIWGFSTGSMPKKYNLYHPSLFNLPEMENCVARESKSLNYPSVPQVLQNSLSFKPHRSFQLNFSSTNDVSSSNNLSNRLNSAYLRYTQYLDDSGLQLEDEGYVSHGATPLGVSPAELCRNFLHPWDDEHFFDVAYEKNTVHLTWEALGVPNPPLEPPTMMEAGPKALESQLKIQDCLILTLEPRIWSQPKDPIPWSTLVRQITYLLIGVESENFIFNKQLEAFELQPGSWAEGISHDAFAAYANDFIVMGTCYRRLSSFLETYGSLESDEVVQQALRSSTKQYLNFYCGACLFMMESLLEKSSLSLLLMRSKLKGLNRQIVGLARAFGKWGDGHLIPNDFTALGHLHRHASGTQWKDLACVLLYILNSACRAYFSLLERWVYSGEVIDESDFFVVPRVEYLTSRSRRYWTRAFSVNSAAVPEFMSGLEPFLLRCGKSVNFLKLCDEKNAVLEDAPSCMDVVPKRDIPEIRDQVDSTIPTEEIKSLSTELDVLSPDGELKTSSLQDSQSQAYEVSSEPTKEDDATSERSVTTIESCDVLSLFEDKAEKMLLKEQEAQEVIDNRMSAVREDLIQSYAKLSEGADKRRLRAEWRIRRMQLRLTDRSSSHEQSSTAEQKIHPSPLLLEPEANSEANSDDLIDFSVSPTCLETSPDIPAFDDAKEGSGDCGTVDDLLQISHIEHLSAETETILDTSEKEKGVDKITISITDENDTKKSGVVGNSTDTALPLNESDILDSPTCSDQVEENQASQSQSSDGDMQKKNLVQVGFTSEENTTEESVTQDLVTDSGVNTESPTSDAVSLMPASPSRTPLARISGLFSYSHGSLDCSSPDEKIAEEEAEHFVWPFKSVLVSLMSHSRKVDAALLKWMLEDQGLVSHLKSLRAYFFLLDGEFGRRLSEDLFSAMQDNPVRKPSVLCLNGMTLNGVLSHALASSPYAASDPNARLLSLTLKKCSGQESGAEQLGCIQMVYEAPWPVNVVLTEEALSKYSRVLDLLLQLKHASWALEDAFLHMRVIDPGKGNRRTAIAGGWKTPLEAVHRSPQYHKLHLYRHQMLNLVRAVQSYITAEVLNASGKNLEEAVANSTSLDEFYAEHVLYVKKILFGCLLNKRSETIYTILKDILKLIMKFHWSLCSRSWFLPPDQDGTDGFNFVHPNFNVLCRIFSAFQEMTEFLLKYAWRLAHHGYQAHLHNLLLMINANNYYNMSSGGDKSGKESESSVPSG